jgi:hypothetical protein
MDHYKALAVKEDFVFVLDGLYRVQTLFVLAITAAAKVDAIEGFLRYAGRSKQAFEDSSIVRTADHRRIPFVDVDLGARRFSHQARESEMVGMGMSQNDSLNGMEAVSKPRQAIPERRDGLVSEWPRVDQGQGVFLDQVYIDRANFERSRNADALYLHVCRVPGLIRELPERTLPSSGSLPVP